MCSLKNKTRRILFFPVRNHQGKEWEGPSHSPRGNRSLDSHRNSEFLELL